MNLKQRLHHYRSGGRSSPRYLHFEKQRHSTVHAPLNRGPSHALSPDLYRKLEALTDSGESVPLDMLRAWTSIRPESTFTHCCSIRFPSEATHGIVKLKASWESVWKDLCMLIGNPKIGDFCLNEALFLDLETTGVTHSVGTIPIVVGMGWFESDDQFVVEQLVLTDPENEEELLREFLEVLGEFRFLVSFNGKSFDTSVLQNRLIAHRLLSTVEASLKLTPHLDLLHIFRSIWGKDVANHKLQTLEQDVLRFERHNDFPGALVPALYSRYLLNEDARFLDPILTHNVWDIVSMAALLSALTECLNGNPAFRTKTRQFNLGLRYLRQGCPQQAFRGLFSLLCEDTPMLPRQSLFRNTLIAARRANQHSHIFPILEGWTREYPDSVEAWEARAKFEEHTLKDYSKALLSAGRIIRLSKPVSKTAISRVKRLSKRLQRSGEKLPKSQFQDSSE